jgi:hypothetical protein
MNVHRRDTEVVMPPVSKVEAGVGLESGTQETVGRELAAKFIAFLETGVPPEGLFTSDAFCDFTMPQWRLQFQGVEGIVRGRMAGHPSPGRVPRSRFDATATGFVLEVEEEWDQDGDSWYCRELFRADVSDGAISELSVYCTGDWDRDRVARHRSTVELLRP